MLKSEKPLSTNNIFFGKLSEKIQPSMLEMFFDCVSKPDKSDVFLDQLILDGHIVCTFFSGKEIGPRALCNRSIICAANNSKAVSDLNAKVKKREFFRPLAPVMLEEMRNNIFIFWRILKLITGGWRSQPKQDQIFLLNICPLFIKIKQLEFKFWRTENTLSTKRLLDLRAELICLSIHRLMLLAILSSTI